MTRTASGLPSLMLPCPTCLVRMTYKASDKTGAHAQHETYGCTCGVEVTRTHQGCQDAA